MSNDLMTILSLNFGILGFIATLVGTYFAYISFINPAIRFRKYLKHPENWEKFQGIEVNDIMSDSEPGTLSYIDSFNTITPDVVCVGLFEMLNRYLKPKTDAKEFVSSFNKQETIQ